MSAEDPKLPFENVLITSAESRDWGYARNRRTVLMSVSAEWVQACASCLVLINGVEFITPNRDYPYEGLSVFVDGETWKFIDAIGVAIRCREGRRLRLGPIAGDCAVEVNPWTVLYHYQTVDVAPEDRFAKLRVTVSYRLHSKPDHALVNAATGETTILLSGISDSDRSELIVTILPLIDIRHVFGTADFGRYESAFSGDDPRRIAVRIQDRRLTVQATRGRVRPIRPPVIMDWRYKLGTGQRTETINGEGAHMTAFTSENKDIAAFFEMECEAGGNPAAITVYYHCSTAAHEAMPGLQRLEWAGALSLENDRQRVTELNERFLSRMQDGLAELANAELKSAMIGRIAGATKFKIAISNKTGEPALIPTAGAWWFKTPWFRDVFEGILNSFHVLMSLSEERRNIGQVILAAFDCQHAATGLIPNRFPLHKGESALYNSSDATLLCFITAGRYCAETKDREVAELALSALMRVLKTLLRDGPAENDGPPRIHKETGLLLSTPQHSWIDTRDRHMSYAGYELASMSSRVSRRFVMDLCDGPVPISEVVACLASPRFFLPEINAQWILVLRSMLSDIAPLVAAELADVLSEDVAPSLEEAKNLLNRANANFLKVFWNDVPGCLYNVVFEDCVTCDLIESEPSVTAAALLGGDIFAREQLERIWRVVQAKLLVCRTLVRYGRERVPFGISVKSSDARIYYNDAQYHSDVIWPRSTAYLLRLLMLVGEHNLAKKIVLNNLDHQMSEGAIFYSHELFSKPSGNNPWKVEETCRNPVPVKNAIQFWSQWCDVVVELFSNR